MKIFALIAMMLAFSPASFAAVQDFNFGETELQSVEKCSLVADCDDDDDNENYARVCAAGDAQGKVYKYWLHWHEDGHVQRVAMKKCRQNSARPETCRPLGCRRSN